MLVTEGLNAQLSRLNEVRATPAWVREITQFTAAFDTAARFGVFDDLAQQVSRRQSFYAEDFVRTVRTFNMRAMADGLAHHGWLEYNAGRYPVTFGEYLSRRLRDYQLQNYSYVMVHVNSNRSRKP